MCFGTLFLAFPLRLGYQLAAHFGAPKIHTNKFEHQIENGTCDLSVEIRFNIEYVLRFEHQIQNGIFNSAGETLQLLKGEMKTFNYLMYGYFIPIKIIID